MKSLTYLRIIRILRRMLVVACLSGLSFGGQYEKYEIREKEIMEEKRQEQRFFKGFESQFR